MVNDKDSSDGLGVLPKKPFFRRIDWAAFWTSAIISFVVYFITAAPTVTLEDSGELAVAGDYLGVPHPPGYPLWTMCAWVFARLLGSVSYLGQPNPAWAITIMSGFFGALAAGLTAMLVTRTSSDLVQERLDIDGAGAAGDGAEGGAAGARRAFMSTACLICGVTASLVFAFSPVMWSQATIVEVYTLNAFFLMLIYLLTYVWMCRPSNRILWVTAFVFGLGLTNYQVLLLAIMPLVMVIVLQNIRLFRDFFLVGVPLVLMMGMMKLGAYPSQRGFVKHVRLDLNSQTSSAVVGWEYYTLAILFTLVFVAAAVVLGLMAARRAEAEKDGAEYRGPEFNGFSLRLILYAVMIVAALGMLSVCVSLPAVAVEELARYAGGEAFRWAKPLMVFFMAVAFLWVFSIKVRGGMWYATAVTGILSVMGLFIVRGALLGLTHPLSGTFAFYIAMNFVFLALAWLMLPSGRVVALTVFAVECGVAVYGYMPLASDTNPPMNWGYPRTWEGFKHAVTRGQYEQIAPLSPGALFSADLVRKVGAYFEDLRTQFTLLLVPLGFVAFSAWRVKIGKLRIRALPIAVCLAVAVAAIVAFDRVVDVVSIDKMRIDKLLTGLLIVIAFIGIQGIVVNQILGLVRKTADYWRTDRSASIVSGIMAFMIAGVFFLAVVGFSNAGSEMVLSASDVKDGTRSHNLLNYGLTALLALLWYASAFAQTMTLLDKDKDNADKGWFRLEIGDFTQRWHIATILGFLMMSLFLIALAKPKYDIQDNFIQKVKFISSHAIFAVWVGYGIAYAVCESMRFGRLSRFVAYAALLSPLLPIHQNYFNDKMASELSSADQNGRDFGWQFGNYQLRGAEAISEELSDDEEPLPNPSYPPAMTQDAVFFGGTDPGRFVPTYMIYSAQVRPDVFLITQNALADITYLDTMRNLYADNIWMPMETDNSKAFNIYVDDVQSGRRPNIGGIEFRPGGGVQVTGAQAVMEINGIITEMIFKKNRDRHDFYVEESYPIQWMYPYLTPHGLIMKLNYDRTEFSGSAVDNDMDFWDWYVRRFRANKLFARDVPGRKAFSKLRNALAGAYASRSMLENSEKAYQEAMALYVYSPESTMSIIQKVLLPQRRLEESLALLLKLQTMDPNNVSLPISEVEKLLAAQNKAQDYISGISKGKQLSENEMLDFLANMITVDYRAQAVQALEAFKREKSPSAAFRARAGLILLDGRLMQEAAREFTALTARDLGNPAIVPANRLRDIYQALWAMQDFDSVERVLVAYLSRPENQQDWHAWVYFATVNLAKGDSYRARIAVENALRFGKQEARALMMQLPHLKVLSDGLEGQGVVPQGGPVRPVAPRP